MAYRIEKLDKNRVKIHVTVPKEQVDAGLTHAVEHIGEGMTIPGFRPGKAPADVVRKRVGDAALMEHAAEELIRAALTEALIDEDLSVVGQPYFQVEKMAPGNDLVFTAEISLMPQITKLVDITKLEVKAEDTTPTPELIAEAKKDLQRMRTTEKRAEAGVELAKGDKAVVDLAMTQDKVSIEGGDAKNHGIFTADEYYIPGFVEKIIGMKEGEERSFTLPFPKDHYQKHLAGKDVAFTVKLNEIFNLVVPEFNDEFAKGFGFADQAALEAKLTENIAEERKREEARRQEKAVLELIAEKSTFDEFSELLVNQEIDKMVQELRVWVTDNGMEFDAYLKSINKSVADMKLDFTPQAILRLKVALILDKVAADEKIVADAAEVDKEVDALAAQMGDNKELRERVYSPQYRDRIEHQLRNRMTVDHLRKIIVK